MQWTIHQIDQTYLDGKLVPTTAHWRCTHTEGEYSGSVYGTASVQGLTDLSLDSVLDHIWKNGVPKEASESNCKRQISDAQVQAEIKKLEEMKGEDVPDPKFKGIEFEGVMCSATKNDQNGLIAVLLAFQLQKSVFKSTQFQFDNGNKLTITAENIMQLIGVWMPFRQNFFKPE